MSDQNPTHQTTEIKQLRPSPSGTVCPASRPPP